MNTVLFDLDGTLLPMNADLFTEAYCGALAKKLVPYGLEPKAMIAALWKGTEAMIANDGSVSNESCFWKVFEEELSITKEYLEAVMAEFYENDFVLLEAFVERTENAAKCISVLKEKGYRLIIATNPLFPKQATRHRIHFAGLDENDFDLYTTFEDSHYCKPNPKFFKEIMEKLNLNPEDCIMVGNDVQEDGVATKVGISCYIITDCLINRAEGEIPFKTGTFDDFMIEIQSWPSVKS